MIDRTSDSTLPQQRDTVRAKLGHGTASIGNLYREVADDVARSAIDAAWDLGVRYFDTAPHYGLGLSERRLGSALANRPREEVTISTKVGRLLEPTYQGGSDLPISGYAVRAAYRRVWDFSADGVKRSLEASLERLGMDRVDVLFIHDPDMHWKQAVDEAYPALADLRSQGIVDKIGVGMNQWQMPAQFVRETDIDLVMLAGRYTLLEQPALGELLPLCLERSISVIAVGVFNSGLMSRHDVPDDARYNYAQAPRPIIERARQLAAVCERHNVALPRAAIQFPFGHPAVAQVAVGSRSAQQIIDASHWLTTPVPDELWDELKGEGLLSSEVPVPSSHNFD